MQNRKSFNCLAMASSLAVIIPSLVAHTDSGDLEQWIDLTSLNHSCNLLALTFSASPCNRKVRTELLQRYGRNRKFYLKRKRYGDYRSEMARSLFCLCPLGWAPWSPRLVESVLLGCIPVIIADNIRLPFPSVLQWSDISLQVAEKDVASLETVLDHVVATNLTVIQKNLWDPVKRKALVFNRPLEEGDATWRVLRELEVLLDRSRRRRRSVGSWRRWRPTRGWSTFFCWGSFVGCWHLICCSCATMACSLHLPPNWQNQ